MTHGSTDPLIHVTCLYGPKTIWRVRVVVHNDNIIITNMEFLVAMVTIIGGVWHQGGHMENNYRTIIILVMNGNIIDNCRVLLLLCVISSCHKMAVSPSAPFLSSPPR